MPKFFLILVFLLFQSRVGLAAPQPVAIKGILDISQWNWSQDGIIDLNGEWEWYWRQFCIPASFYSQKPPSITSYVSVPGVWNANVPDNHWTNGQGYSTYRLKVIAPKETGPLALKVLTASTAMELYVDGQKIGQEGQIGTSVESMEPAFRPFEATFIPTNDTIEIVIFVSNFHYRKGGLWNVIKLGKVEQISQLRTRNLTRDYFVAGSFLLIGLYHLFLYIFLRRTLLPVFFCLFCCLLSIRILTTGEYGINVWTNWGWNTIIHLEFLSLYVAPLVFALYSHYLFPEEVSKRVIKWVVLGGLVFVAFALFTSPILFTYGVRPFQVYLVLVACYGTVVYIKAWKNRRIGSNYFLFGFVVLLLMVLNDVLYTSFVINTGHFFYLGLLLFVFSQALTLSRQYSIAFADMEGINRQLEDVNVKLTRKNRDVENTNEQLMKLNAEMDGVVYRVSHDLRSPIASVLGLVGLVRHEKNTSELQRYLDLQEKTLRRMDVLIQDIIDYSQNNSTDLKPESINFHKIVEDVLTDHSHLEQAVKIKKVVEINQPCLFHSDPKRLSMIFNNLISNAIRYHNLSQDNPFIEVKIEVSPEKTVIAIRDNGQGISQEHMDKVFDMFYRANHVTKGSGLGLYIVKEAVTKLKGTIDVESKVNQGTTFRITLPDVQIREN